MKSRTTAGAWCAVVAMLVLAGCGGSSDPEPKAAKEDATPVTLADLTDEPSVKIEYPTIKIPKGAEPAQVDWLVRQLMELTKRSLDVEKVSQGSEADAVRWVTQPIQGSDDFDFAPAFRKEMGSGYSFALGNRFARDAQPTGPVHVLGLTWESKAEEGRLAIRVIVEEAIPFEDGVAVVRRWTGLSGALNAGTSGRPGIQAYYNTLGVDRCAMAKGAARPGDLAEVADQRALLTERKEKGGLSAWALEDDAAGPSNKSDDVRKECAAKK